MFSGSNILSCYFACPDGSSSVWPFLILSGPYRRNVSAIRLAGRDRWKGGERCLVVQCREPVESVASSFAATALLGLGRFLSTGLGRLGLVGSVDRLPAPSEPNVPTEAPVVVGGSFGSPKTQASRRSIPIGPIVCNTLREWRLRLPRSDQIWYFQAGRVHHGFTQTFFIGTGIRFARPWASTIYVGTTSGILQCRYGLRKISRRRS